MSQKTRYEYRVDNMPRFEMNFFSFYYLKKTLTKQKRVNSPENIFQARNFLVR